MSAAQAYSASAPKADIKHELTFTWVGARAKIEDRAEKHTFSR